MSKIIITIEVTGEDEEEVDQFVLESAIHRCLDRYDLDDTIVEVREHPGHETNVGFFTRVSETAPRGGALTQCFALDAIGKHADRVAATSDEDLAALFADNAFISWQAWKAAALDWVEAFKTRNQH